MINRMSSGIFKGSLFYMNMYILTCNLILVTRSAVDIHWEATFPVVFGKIAYLQCNISDTAASNCTTKNRQWIGGPKYDSLCLGDECYPSNKYEVMKQSRCQYTLMIHNFSEEDVNCEYTCSYGVSRFRQHLTLDENRFIYKPHVEDIQEESTEKGNTLNWKINISKMFPTPSCGADQEGENITDRLQISVTEPGFYYAAALQINFPLSSCGKVDVHCFLGDYKVKITTKNFDSCHLQVVEQSNKNNTLMMGLIIVAIILVIACMGCVYWTCWTKLCLKQLREDVPAKTEVMKKQIHRFFE